MKKLFSFIFPFLILLVFLIGCSSNYVVHYVYDLDGVSSDYDNTFEKTLYGRYNFYYIDKDLEMYFDVDPYEVAVRIKNITRDTLRIIWDNTYLETDIDSVKRFKLAHINRKQEQISLDDTTAKNYEKLKIIKALQLSDSIYTVQPTIILPGDTFTDRLINASQGYFYTYEIENRTMLDNVSAEIKNKNLIIHFPFKFNDNSRDISFTIKIKNYYIVKKGT